MGRSEVGRGGVRGWSKRSGTEKSKKLEHTETRRIGKGDAIVVQLYGESGPLVQQRIEQFDSFLGVRYIIRSCFV